MIFFSTKNLNIHIEVLWCVSVCSISSSINFIESQCAPAILCDVWWVWVCVRLCACPCVLPRYFRSAHTNTTTHCTSNSNQIAFYLYRARLFSSSSLRMSKLPSSLHTHNFPSSSSSFSWFISVSSAHSHACLLACSRNRSLALMCLCVRLTRECVRFASECNPRNYYCC